MGPLNGVRVVDLTRVLAGPFGTAILGDLGAEIIKVERPESGDDTRGFAPPFLKDENDQETDLSAYYCGANRNKKSITIVTNSTRQMYKFFHVLFLCIE